MSISPIPGNERRRLEIVRSLRHLREEPDAAFRYIANVAADHFKVPVSLVNIVDSEETWCAGQRGFDLPSIRRVEAFCSHTVMSGELLIVEDTRQDSRFSDNPYAIGDAAVRFYAGAPLVAQDCALGTVCILDQKPRTFSAGQKAVLRNLADIAIAELKLRMRIADHH